MALVAFGLWFALKDDYEQVIENIQRLPIYVVLFVCALGILYYSIQGAILTYVAKKYKPEIRLRDGIENAYVAAFFNGVTPLGGGQVAQSYVFRKMGIDFGNIASILWTDFFMFQIVVITYAALLIIFNLPFALETLGGYFIFVLAGLAINSFVIVALWMMSKFPKLFIKLTKGIVFLLHKIRIVKDEEVTFKKWKLNLDYFSEQIVKMKGDKSLFFVGIPLNIIRMTIFYAVPFFIAMAFGFKFDFIDFMHVLAISSFVHMLNALTPLPGDTGFTETMFILIFSSMFSSSYAPAIMIIWRLATYYIHVIIGGAVFLAFKIRYRKKEEDVA
ncbi:lysylphosphatidylglycerol synthase transmembrane domain-containing protein [Breznakia pachnodae]|uniref:Phosphatidylglycerol lysyltransferase n=1 Tax=Breznakia pachnodae TaxID=265178 RepID=A0ABU0E4B0_9FIRM|nr:lysylphosphatidylglycerol synthase transmembrane domain-containing protein [Breznakia pachnodae]MDQ0361743.1 uncharacterized protein (TIRG00374 family) [Breznakia pachnodae]